MAFNTSPPSDLGICLGHTPPICKYCIECWLSSLYEIFIFEKFLLMMVRTLLLRCVGSWFNTRGDLQLMTLITLYFMSSHQNNLRFIRSFRIWENFVHLFYSVSSTSQASGNSSWWTATVNIKLLDLNPSWGGSLSFSSLYNCVLMDDCGAVYRLHNRSSRDHCGLSWSHLTI